MMRMSSLRGMLDQWLDKMRIHPKVVGEFDDNALLLVFGQAGEGVFMVLTVFETEVKQQYQVQIIGRTDKIR
ncbi:type 2 periplasmic-binding domain-containing protein [Desulfopila aestuarii]|nr:hypothetical protein [Desulfopila aestuarii]